MGEGQVSVGGPTLGSSGGTDILFASYDGTIETAVPATSASLFQVSNSYPNPFNPSTTIAFTLERSEHVSFKVFDVSGRKVIDLLDEVRGPGTWMARWDGRGPNGVPVSSGTYFYRFVVGGQSKTGKLVLIK